MKSICQASQKSLMIGLPALLLGAALFLRASPAQARGFVAVGGGYRAGYGYGYSYPVIVSSGASSTTRTISSSLPSGYVAILPAGAAPVVVFGKTYYFANGNYYSPVFYGGSTVYLPANP